MKFLATLFIIFSPVFLFGQQRAPGSGPGFVKGIVKDSINGFGLQSVTVTVYKKSDSTLLDYQLTNDQGAFSFQNIPLGTPVIFNLTFTGYKPFSQTITLDSANRSYNFKPILLPRSYGSLNEVVVNAAVPIRMNGDTLEINPAAFKLDKNAVVEDMLRRVPGMTIWGDGNITVNGKPIDKVYVDGKPFYGGDPAIATQNLPKDAIDKVQVYQDIDNTNNDVDLNPEDSVFTMDIKLKADKKKGLFGKAGAGIGTDNRYEADATVQAYNNKSRLGLMGMSNNINKTGDMGTLIRQSTYRNYNQKNSYVANFGGAGINKVIQGGLNYQHDFSDINSRRFNNEFTGSYNIRQNTNSVLTQTNSQQSGSGIVFNNSSDRNAYNNNLSHALNAGYNKRDRNRDFAVNSSFNTSTTDGSSTTDQSSMNENNEVLSTNENSTSSHGNNKSLSFSTSYRNRDDDERNLKSFNVSYNFNYGQSNNDRNTITNFVSLADASKSNYLNRNFKTENSNFSNTINFGYNALKRLLFGNFNLWDINITFNNNLSISKNSADNEASDLDTLTHTRTQNGYLTYFNNVTRINESPSIRFSKSFFTNLTDRFSRYINLSANLGGQFLSDKNHSNISVRNLDRNYGFFLPGAGINYNFKKIRRYEINMNLSQSNSASIPGIDQLYPIIDSTNQYTFALGNPNLRPYYNSNISYNFKYTKQNNKDKGEFNFNAFFRTGQTRDGITDSSFYADNGTREVYLINIRKGQKNISTGLTVNASFKLKNMNVLQLAYTTNYSKNTSPNYIDGIFSLSKNDVFTNNASVFFALADLATFQVAQSISYNTSLQSGKTLKSFNNTLYNTNATMNLNFPKNFSFGNTFNYLHNKSVDQHAALWNAFVTYRFLRNKSAEIKFSAMDILRQNHNITVNASANNLTTTVTNGLQQFYLLTLSYYPRSFGGGVVSERQSRGGRGGRQR